MYYRILDMRTSVGFQFRKKKLVGSIGIKEPIYIDFSVLYDIFITATIPFYRDLKTGRPGEPVTVVVIMSLTFLNYKTIYKKTKTNSPLFFI